MCSGTLGHDEIPNIQPAICQNWIELWCSEADLGLLQHLGCCISPRSVSDAGYLHMGRHPQKRQIDSVISSCSAVCFLSFGTGFLLASQIAWFFYIKYLQSDLIFFCNFLQDSSASWMKATELNLVTAGLYDSSGLVFVAFAVDMEVN